MKIQVTRDFAGRLTKERRILPGVYDSEDPALMGLADYLAENGFAVWVYEETVIEDKLIPVNPPAKPAPPKASRKPTKAKARK